MNYGYVTIAAAIPSVRVADTHFNSHEIIKTIVDADKQNVEVVCFPELCITGYSCQDLFGNKLLVDQAEEALMDIMQQTRKLDIIAILGMPIESHGMLMDCAVVVQHGSVLGVVPKTFLPNNGDVCQTRWFASAHNLLPCEIFLAGSPIELSGEPKLFKSPSGCCFGIELCEDILSPMPPSNNLAIAGADIIFNLSASYETVGKYNSTKQMLSQHSSRLVCGYVYCSCGFGESTQDVVYTGNAMVFEKGKLIASSNRFSIEPQLCIAQIDIEMLHSERRRNTIFTSAQSNVHAKVISLPLCQPKEFKLTRNVCPLPFVPTPDKLNTACDEILNIQSLGLVKRLRHTGCTRVVVGVSGGLDSTLALLVCVLAFDKMGLSRKGIIGVTMPGFGTSSRTHDNALELMESLGIEQMEISIADSVLQHFKDIGHSADAHDATYENSQARERTQILMDLSNKLSAMVIGTGDLSELALGWCTYNGDHMSMYSLNASLPKTLIRPVVRYFADNLAGNSTARTTLLDILETPISPELLPVDSQGNINQKTEDLVGPYELHDFFIYYTLKYGFTPSKIFMLASHAFNGSNPEAGTYDAETIKHWLKNFYRRFFSQQFKRNCMPDGPKVGVLSFSPRTDWHMPSDATPFIWLESIDNQ